MASRFDIRHSYILWCVACLFSFSLPCPYLVSNLSSYCISAISAFLFLIISFFLSATCKITFFCLRLDAYHVPFHAVYCSSTRRLCGLLSLNHLFSYQSPVTPAAFLVNYHPLPHMIPRTLLNGYARFNHALWCNNVSHSQPTCHSLVHNASFSLLE